MNPLGIDIDMVAGWLWQTSWDVCLLVLLISVIRFTLGRWMAPKWLFTLWLLVVIRVLTPWTPMSVTSIHNLWKKQPVQNRATSASAGGVPINVQSLSLASGQDISPTAVGRKAYDWTKLSWKDAGLLIWAGGMIFLSGYMIFGNVRLAGKLKNVRPSTDAELLNLLEDCKEEMGVNIPISVIVSPLTQTPLLMGWLRPRIILPEQNRGLFTHQDLRHVLLHELAHLRRGDILWNWLVTLVTVILWFNPLVWWAFRVMRNDREQAADALAVGGSGRQGNPKEYGETLLKLVENWSLQAPIPGATGIFEEKHQIKERLQSLMRGRLGNEGSGMALVCALVLMGMTFTRASDQSSSSKHEKTPSEIARATDLEQKSAQYLVHLQIKDSTGKIISMPQIGTISGRMAKVTLGEDYPFEGGVKVFVGNSVSVTITEDKGNNVRVRGNIEAGFVNEETETEMKRLMKVHAESGKELPDSLRNKIEIKELEYDCTIVPGEVVNLGSLETLGKKYSVTLAVMPQAANLSDKAVHKLSHEIGAYRFLEGNEIVIDEMKASEKTLRKGTVIQVKGRYKLGAVPRAMLSLTVMSKPGQGGVSVMNPDSMTYVNRGNGTFELKTIMPYDGYPNINLNDSEYKGNNCVGKVFVGVGDSVNRKMN